MPKLDADTMAPPYVSFTTFASLLDRWHEQGLPPRIDRSFLTQAEGIKTQILAALKSLGLVDEANAVLPKLSELVTAESDQRKMLLRVILESRYPDVVRLGSVNATQQQMEEAFRALGPTGDTLRKAASFYLKAAECTGIPVSPHWKTPGSKPAATVTRRRSRQSKAPIPHEPALPSGGEGSLKESPVAVPSPQSWSRVHPAIDGVLRDLPTDGSAWTSKQRDRFLTAFTAVVDYAIPITEEHTE